MRMSIYIPVLLLAVTAVPAVAQTVPPGLAAEQVMHDFNTGGFVLGQNGNATFKYAQTFQLPQEGFVSHIMLPIYCSTATSIRVELRNVRGAMPSTLVLATQNVPAYVLNSWTSANGMQSMRMVEFDRPPLLKAGDYAFTIAAIGGQCMLWPGPASDTYAGGQAFLINGVSLLSWYPWNRDLAFQVFERPR